MLSVARRPLALTAALLAALALACGGDSAAETPADGSLRGRITIFAAASLTDAFGEIANRFEALHPATEVVFNFAGSPTLCLQLELGARADVFASADQAQMERAQASGSVRADDAVFARNRLVVIVPAANPAAIGALADLQRDGLKLVIADEAVPAGAYTRQLLAALAADPAFGAGFTDAVLANVVSLESNVKQVVAKVELGEADAGVVYSSDVTPAVAPRLTWIEVPTALNVRAEYAVALTREAANAAVARAFVDFLLSPPAQAVMRQHGFS